LGHSHAAALERQGTRELLDEISESSVALSREGTMYRPHELPELGEHGLLVPPERIECFGEDNGVLVGARERAATEVRLFLYRNR
jgi:hypothetical protein